MWFKFSLILLVCILMVIINAGGMTVLNILLRNTLPLNRPDHSIRGRSKGYFVSYEYILTLSN
jgi:hypothetical protein